MLVGEDVVESPWGVWRADPGDHLDTIGIRQAGHIEHHRTQIEIRPVTGQLDPLDIVIPALALEIDVGDRAVPGMELLLFNSPGIENLRLGRILHVDDVYAVTAARRRPAPDVSKGA